MEDYKEFTGKNLDEAMAAACEYFGLERGKLEIEILNDAKSGIFGLVGAKKASVRARKARLESLNLKVGEKLEEKKAPRPQPKAHKDPKAEKRPEPRQEPEADGNRLEPERSEAGEGRGQQQRGQGKGRPEQRGRQNRAERPRPPRPDKPKPAEHDEPEDKFPEVPLESMDQARLEAEVLGAVEAMTRPIVGETDKEFEISGGKARVRINSGEDSGLLIGRDGQTLSALQYLASCIVSRRLQASVRVQIDAGDYRNRQLEKLRQTALELAQKVKDNGKPQSTRPMSAYLRRVVHMALQDDPDVQTHSKGEGSLKRVVIVPRKK